MMGEVLSAWNAEQYLAAAHFLEAQADALVASWQPVVDRALEDFDQDTQGEVRALILAVPRHIIEALRSGEDGELLSHLWTLAETAWRRDVPYAVLSRALRCLGRTLRQTVVATQPDTTASDPVYGLLEELTDELRLQVSNYHNLLSRQRLSDSEQLARFLLNHVSDAVLVVGASGGGVRYVNAEAARLTGRSSSSLLTCDVLSLFDGADRAAVESAMERGAAGTPAVIENVTVVRPDAEPVTMRLTVQRVRQMHGSPMLQMSLQEPGAESLQLERDSRFYEAFLEQTLDAVVGFDLGFRVQYWNSGAEQMFGYTAAEMLHEPLSRLLPEGALDGLDDLNETLERHGHVRDVVTVLLARDGDEVECNITVSAVYDPRSRQRIGATAVLRDETEKRELQRASADQAHQLETINRVIQASSRTLDQGELHRELAEELVNLFACDLLTLTVPVGADGAMAVHILKGDETYTAGQHHPMRGPMPLIDQAAQKQGPLRIPDLSILSDLGPADAALVRLGYRSVLLAPLVYDLELTGVLALYSHRLAAYTEDDEALLGRLAGHWAVAVENTRRFEMERKRSAQFELISRVGAAAIANIGDVGRLLHSTVAAIQQDFGYHDVALYEVVADEHAFSLRAQAGSRRRTLGEGYSQDLDLGIFGEVYRTGNSILVRDLSVNPIYVDPAPASQPASSELCVPIRVGPKVLGVLDVESEQPNAFDPLDQAAMEALAGLLARCMQADETLHQQRMFQSLRRHIMEAVPSALLLLDDSHKVQFVNRRYLEFYRQRVDEVIGRHYSEVFPPDLIAASRMPELLERVVNDLSAVDSREVKYHDFAGNERFADVRIRIVTEYQTSIIVMLHDSTARMARVYQLQMLREISDEMQRILDIDRLLRAILTCITAGPGFGFNRAALYLYDRAAGVLRENLRVGPNSAAEAGAIWREVSHGGSIRDYLQSYDAMRPIDPEPRHAVIVVPEASTGLEAWRQPVVISNEHLEYLPPLAARLWQTSGAPEVVVVPLVNQDQVRGLIIADNLFNGEPITSQSVDTLTVFASQAGVALANAQAFEELATSLADLREAQRRLRGAERLAGIGRMASHVAHEIRNPLVSIGGFARRAMRMADHPDEVRDYLSVVADEVQRLERILKNVMDFTAPGKPQVAPVDVNDVLREVLTVLGPPLEDGHFTVVTDLGQDLPAITVDRDKVKQVVLNLCRNAMQAMAADGTLTLTSQALPELEMVEIVVGDTGPGVPPDKIEEIFNPFYTQRVDGTGLGLAVSQKIVVDHGGSLQCESVLGEGSRFVIRLPVDATAAVNSAYGSEQ